MKAFKLLRQVGKFRNQFFSQPIFYNFCNQIKPDQIIKNITENSASYALNDIPGTKEGGEIYALMLTCGPCDNKMARTFTKNAYHNGVVLIRCDKCQNIHLIADNLGWFEDNKWNVETNLNAKKISNPEVEQIISEFTKQQQDDNKTNLL